MISVIGSATPARAQNTASARADELFSQGKAALEAKDYARACPSLTESYRLDPSTGTLVALALCHEGIGLTTTAWREFSAVVNGSAKDGRIDRVQYARMHMESLEAMLSHLVVIVPDAAPEGLSVDIDGTRIVRGDWGKPLPLDPGHHTVSARAPGQKAWSAGVDIGTKHDLQTVSIGISNSQLVSGPADPTGTRGVAAAASDAHPGGSWKGPAGWFLGAAGVAAVGVGTVFGLDAIAKNDSAKKACPSSLCTNPSALNDNTQAKSDATIADVVIGAGLVGLVTATVFLISAPSASRSTSAASYIAPYVGPRQAGLGLQVGW